MKDSGSYSKKIVDDLLDQITGGDHSKTIYQLKQVGPGYAEMKLIKQFNQHKNSPILIPKHSLLSIIIRFLIDQEIF